MDAGHARQFTAGSFCQTHADNKQNGKHFPPRFLPHSLMLLKCLPHHFFFDPTGNEGTPFIPLRIPDYYLYTPHPQRKTMNSREVHCLTVRTMSLRTCEGQFWI